VLIYKLPLTHISNYILFSEHGGAGYPLIVYLELLSIALQGHSYVNYGHLDVSVIDGRGKNVWPIALICQILKK
jgi:hypothetical protein